MDFLESLRNQMFKINLFKTWQKYFSGSVFVYLSSCLIWNLFNKFGLSEF